MSRPKKIEPPPYRHHKARNLARVTIDGHDHYLGPYGSPESRAAYDRLIGAWLANGRQLPEPWTAQASTAQPAPSEITICEIVDQYREWSIREYGDTRTGEHRNMMDCLRPVVRVFGRMPASAFGPNALREVRQLMIEGKHRIAREGEPGPMPLSRTTVNGHMHRIRRVFRWALSHQLVPAAVVTALQAVEPLRAGRGHVREGQKIRPVSEDVVNATLPYLPPVVADMVRLQLLTGMRSGELCVMRGGDIDTAGKVWIYTPERHKTQRLGHERTVYLGPRAQAIVKPYLTADLQAYLFSPRKARADRYAALRASRKSPVQPSQRNRQKRHAKRLPGAHYTPGSYGYAIARACAKHGIEHWHPHQVRHTVATRIRRERGVDLAKVILGHSSLDATAIYAEADQKRAAEVMVKIG